MTKEALREEYNKTKELSNKFDRTNLTSYHLAFLNLYQNVRDEYEFQFPAAKFDSDFYHALKSVQKMDDFPSWPKKKQELGFSDLRGESLAALNDLGKLIAKLK